MFYATLLYRNVFFSLPFYLAVSLDLYKKSFYGIHLFGRH